MVFNYPNPEVIDDDSQDNDLATATLAAQGVGKRQSGLMLWCGYSAQPGAGKKVVVKVDGSVKLTLPITEAGPAPIPLSGIITGPNESLSAELDPAGTAGIIGYVAISAKVL